MSPDKGKVEGTRRGEMARRMAAGVNVRSVGTIRDRGDVYAISPQVDSGHNYFHSLLLLSAEVVTIFSLCMLGFLVFLIIESLPLVGSLVLSIHDFFS